MNQPQLDILHQRSASRRKPHSIALGLVLLLAPFVSVQGQQIPALSDIAPRVAASHPDLIARRTALQKERDSLHAQVRSMNERCASVEEGSSAAAACQTDQAALRSELTAHIQRSKDFNSEVQTAITVDPPLSDSMIVDARHVPSGLPKDVEDEIPHTAAGDRVRKGFQAIADHDWKVALAWFRDALNHEPGNSGIQRLIELAEYTIARQSRPATTAMVPENAGAQDKAATAAVDKQMDDAMNADNLSKLHNQNTLNKQVDEGMNADEERALADFNRYYFLKHSEKPDSQSSTQDAHWKAFFDSIFKPPAKTHIPGSVSGVRD
jgi:hypothetical protein